MTDGPGMRGTRWTDLAVPFIVVAVTVYILLRFSYSSLPPLQYFVPVPLTALAVAEFVARLHPAPSDHSLRRLSRRRPT